MKFDDLWPNLETLTDSELDALKESAAEDRRYQLELAGLYVALLSLITSVGYLGGSAIYHAFHPSYPARIVVALVFLAGIWIGVRVLLIISIGCFNRSLMRAFRRRSDPGAA